MPLNPDAVGAESAPGEKHWDSKDAILYALGVGAGVDELAFTTENTQGVPQQVLPTMAVVLSTAGRGAWDKVGEFNWAMLVHGEQAVELHAPVPVEGTARTVSPITWCRTGPPATKRCCTGCPAIATRCTRIRRSPRWAASTGRSCTGCAATASPGGRCSTRCAPAIRPASSPWRRGSRRRCFRATS